MKQKIKQELKQLADEKYKEFHKGLCPGTENILGIRVPVLRDYAKKLSKECEIRELLNCIDNEYYEEIMLQGMLIGLEKDKDKDKDKNKDIQTILKDIEEFVPKIDNWAVCDVFCAGLKITKKHEKEMWDFLQKYVTSDKEFEIRFGVVMILDYYITEAYLDKNFAIFDHIKSDKYYVQMAVAWAISICLIKFYDRTIEYLKQAKIDKFTYNKALQKAIESYRISDEQKAELRKMKKM